MARKITLQEKTRVRADNLFDDVMRSAVKKSLDPQSLTDYELVQTSKTLRKIHSKFPSA